MAKAHQQYYADEVNLQKIAREFSPTQELLDEIAAGENVIEEVQVNGTPLVPDANKAVNVPVPLVVDALDSTSTADALSAKQGKVLYDYIQNISARGRFLSNWNCATGLATTNPEESPYTYRAGDYFIVSNIAAVGGTNYRPSGASYVIGQASTDVETASVGVSDLYIYDGTNWILMSNGGGGSIAVDSSLSTTSTNPVENRVITNELNKKYYGVVSNSAPSTPTLGMIWYDTTSGNFKTYDGSGWVRKLDLGLNKVFDNSTVEIGKWVDEGGMQGSGHHVTIDPNGEVSTYNVTVAGHNEATLGSGTLELLSNTALGGDETLTINHEQIVANDGTNTQIYSFFGNDRIAKLSDIGGGYSAGTGINITNNVISADTTVLATKTDLDEKQDTLTAGNNITITCPTESDMKGPSPSGFHIPDNSEFRGIYGVLTNTFGLAASGSTLRDYLKMPYAGYRSYLNNGRTVSTSEGYYCTSQVFDSSGPYYFMFRDGYVRPDRMGGAFKDGYSIRCFKNTPVVPDNTWTTLHDGSSVATGAGVFHNAALGLISVSGDGTTWTTIMDKNLGATTVYNNGNTKSEANCGGFFQFGNNYMFPYSGDITITSTQVDSTGYGPGNYYYSSNFIICSGDDWSSVSNNNRRGYVTHGTFQDCEHPIISAAGGATYTAGNGISIDANNEISNTLPGAIVSAAAPSNPSEGDLWYDTTNDVLKSYDGTSWNECGTESNVKYFYIHNPIMYQQDAIADVQAIWDWYHAGAWRTILAQCIDGFLTNIEYDVGTHVFTLTGRGYGPDDGASESAMTYVTLTCPTDGNGVVQSVTYTAASYPYLSTNYNYSTPYTPLYAGSPTTKQYVDGKDTYVGSSAPSTPYEGQLWYDTANDSLKAYNGTSWEAEGTKMVVLEYGVSTWQDFLDAYNKNALVYCKVSSGSSGYRMAFMAYTAGQGTPTEVEFQYYRSRSSHSTAANQLDEVYVYKLTNAGVWTTTQRDTAAKAIAGTGIGLSFNSSGMTISADTTVLATQTDLSSKADATNVNLKSFGTFPGSGLSDLQALYDWLAAGNYAEVTYDHMIWIFGPTNITTGEVESYYLDETPVDLPETGRITGKRTHIEFTVSNGTVTGAYGSSSDATSQVWGVRVNSVAPTIGTATNCFWYDTSTHKLKAWNGSSWDIVGDESADINTKTFYLPDTTGAAALAVAQEAVDWLLAGKNPIVKYSGYSYLCVAFDSQNSLFLVSPYYSVALENNSVSKIRARELDFSLNSNNEVTAITAADDRVTRVLSTDINYSTPYTPLYDGSPATKKYVDDSVNTKTFYLSGNLQSAESIAAAQAAYDWYLAGKNPLIYYGLKSYSLETVSSSNMFFYANSIGSEYIKENWIMFDITGSTVDSISAGDYRIDAANTKTFTLPANLSSQEAIAVAQEAFDWYRAGKTPIIRRENDFNIYKCSGENQSGLIAPITYRLEFDNVCVAEGIVELANYRMPSSAVDNKIRFTYNESTNVVTQVERIYIQKGFLPTDSSVEVLYEPHRAWDPTTKQYVDDRTTNVKVFSPASPMSNADALAIAEYTNNTGTAIIRYNGDEYFPAGTEDRSQPGVVYIDGTPTGYIYKTHPSDSSNVIKIIDITATIGLNSSSLDNISYSSMGVMLNNTTGTSSIISDQWVGTEAEYNLLSSYGADTIYFII